MKRIAIVRSFPKALDINSYNVQEIGLSKALSQQGISVDIYSCFSKIKLPSVIFEGNDSIVTLYPLKPINFIKITLYRGLVHKILNGGYDAVQLHEESQFMTYLISKACFKKKIRTILYQGMYTDYSGLTRLFQVIFDLNFKSSIQKTCNIKLAKTKLACKYLEKKGYNNIIILPIGLDLTINESIYSDISLIDSFKKVFDKLLLYVGTLEQRRNPLFLLDLLNKMCQNSQFNIGLIIVGKGPLKYELVKYAKKLNIQNRILFIDQVPNSEIGSIYKKCDLFLLPSNHEIYGMVVLEALFYGIPVIATPTAGPLDILKKQDYGMCIELELSKWTEAILSYLKSDKKGESLHNYVREFYNWELIAKTYRNILNESIID